MDRQGYFQAACPAGINMKEQCMSSSNEISGKRPLFSGTSGHYRSGSRFGHRTGKYLEISLISQAKNGGAAFYHCISLLHCPYRAACADLPISLSGRRGKGSVVTCFKHLAGERPPLAGSRLSGHGRQCHSSQFLCSGGRLVPEIYLLCPDQFICRKKPGPGGGDVQHLYCLPGGARYLPAGFHGNHRCGCVCRG